VNKLSIDRNSKQNNINRREFLKVTGGLGAAASTATLSSELLAAGYPDIGNTNRDCGFSAFAPDFVYLNSGTEGSMPTCVLEALNNKLARWASRPTDSYETDEALGKHQRLNREKVAGLLSVEKNNICLTDNTTMGLSMVLMGLNFNPKDKVILTNHEHNAIISPLMVQQEKLGLTLIKRDFPPARQLSGMTSAEVLDYLFPDTAKLRGARALCVSHVYPTTGTQLPLEQLRKKAAELNIEYLVVDGAQAFGMLDISQGHNKITHADFYACPGHKWLNGPPSTGILYLKNDKIRPPEFYPTLSQRMPKFGVNEDGSVTTFPMAEALQVRGCSNTPGFAAMLVAMEFRQKMGGSKRIEQHILALSKQVKHFILSLAPQAMVSPFKAEDLHSGLTVFSPFSWNQPGKLFHDRKTAEFVVDELLKRNIRIRSIALLDSNSETQISYALRVSTALFNTREQLDLFEVSLHEVLTHL